MTPPHHPGRMDHGAVSTVVGAMLVFSILITATVAMQLTFVPIWDEEKEAHLADEVRSQFAQLKADVDRAGDNETSTTISHGFSLGTQASGRWLRSEATGASLEFEADKGASRIDAEILDVVRQNGRARALTSETWSQSTGQSNITEIHDIDSLRLRFTKQGAQLSFGKNAITRIDITDADGLYAGAVHAYVPEGGKADLWLRVVNANGEELLDTEYVNDAKLGAHNHLWIDLMDPSVPFAAVLQAAKAPYALELTYNFPEVLPPDWPLVDYAISYRTVSETGEPVYAGGTTGAVVTNYARSQDGGILRYKYNGNRLPGLELILEHGAVLNTQDDQTSMVVPPHFRASKAGDTMLVRASIPRLTGPSDSVAGTKEAIVTTRSLDAFSAIGLSDRVTITLDTAHGQVWADHFRLVLAQAGYGEGAGYAVQATPTQVVLQLEGDSNAPDVRDVQLEFVQNEIEVRLP